MISIIIPIFNTEKYLNDCLESVSKQSYRDYEVIMVDDGSQDGSAAICQRYAGNDSRFRYIYQDNSGVSVARNKGLEQSKGEWVIFIDADDIIDEFFLDEMLVHSDGVDLVHCKFTSDVKLLGSKGDVVQKTKEVLLRDIIYEKLNVGLCTFMFKNEIINDNGLCFTPGCIRNEDYEFFMKYITYCKKPIALGNYIGYFYRQNPSSVMHQKRSRDSVIMSIEASTRVGEAVEGIGVVEDKIWLTSFAIITQLFIMARENNRAVYEELHQLYPVLSFTKTSLLHGGFRVKCAAFLYFVLRKRSFYNLISVIYSKQQ